MGTESLPLPEGRTALIPLRLVGDERLAERAAGGDRAAYAQITERYHEPLYRYCRSIVQNEEDARDALQNTLLAAMQALEGERREIELRPWLYRIAHNESVSLLRRRRPEASLEAASAVAGSPDPAEVVATRERLGRLVEDLKALPERQRGALVMRELSGLSYREIAAALGTGEAAAKQTVYEARLALHESEEGRDMACEEVRRSLSDGDGRVLRARKVRAHLRGCASCRRFGEELKARPAGLAAIAPPLPPVLAAGVLQSVLGSAAGGAGAGGAGGGILGLAGGAGGATATGAVGGGAAAAGGGAAAAAASGAVMVVTAALAVGAVAVETAGDPGAPRVREAALEVSAAAQSLAEQARANEEVARGRERARVRAGQSNAQRGERGRRRAGATRDERAGQGADRALERGGRPDGSGQAGRRPSGTPRAPAGARRRGSPPQAKGKQPGRTKPQPRRGQSRPAPSTPPRGPNTAPGGPGSAGSDPAVP